MNDSSLSLANKHDRVYMNGRAGLQPYVLSLRLLLWHTRLERRSDMNVAETIRRPEVSAGEPMNREIGTEL